MIEIDGSIGEGGGQVLRTSLSLSCILGIPVSISNIRANRPKPGLSCQHLEVANSLAKICGGKAEGAKLGSTQISFSPGKILGDNYAFEIKTAGSAVLLAQAILPVLLRAKEKSAVSIIGGTHVSFAPTFDYFGSVFLPAIRKFGANAEARIEKYGFYPTGGGKMLLELTPAKKLTGADFTKKSAAAPKAIIVSSSLPPHVPEREKKEILAHLPDSEIAIISPSSSCPGNAITIWSGFCGACAIGERGKSSEDIAKKAIADFECAYDFGTDEHLLDQLLLYCALSYGNSRLHAPKMTSHAQTNMQIISKFLPSARFIETKGDNTLTVTGAGVD